MSLDFRCGQLRGRRKASSGKEPSRIAASHASVECSGSIPRAANRS